MDWCVNATTTIDVLCLIGSIQRALIWGILAGGIVGLLAYVIRDN